MQPYINPTSRNMKEVLNIFEMEDDLIFLKMENNINFFLNGIGPHIK